MEKIIIVSRHQGALDWLKKHHPEFNNAKYLSHINEKDIKDNIVIGTLPINLAILAKQYWHLSMSIPSEMRGIELTVEDMENFGCKIEGYIIKHYCKHSKSDFAIFPQCYICSKCGEYINFK